MRTDLALLCSSCSSSSWTAVRPTCSILWPYGGLWGHFLWWSTRLSRPSPWTAFTITRWFSWEPVMVDFVRWDKWGTCTHGGWLFLSRNDLRLKHTCSRCRGLIVCGPQAWKNTSLMWPPSLAIKQTYRRCLIKHSGRNVRFSFSCTPTPPNHMGYYAALNHAP